MAVLRWLRRRSRPGSASLEARRPPVLILTRKAEQGIVIAGKVAVRLLSVDSERVEIGIEAPRSVSVPREELLVEVADQKVEASRIPATSGHEGLA